MGLYVIKYLISIKTRGVWIYEYVFKLAIKKTAETNVFTKYLLQTSKYQIKQRFSYFNMQ